MMSRETAEEMGGGENPILRIRHHYWALIGRLVVATGLMDRGVAA